MELESNSSTQTPATQFREEALDFGITGETVARMVLAPERALACLRAARDKGAGAGLAVHMFDAGDFPQEKNKVKGVNLHSEVACETCGGDRFIVGAERLPIQSAWMAEQGITPSAHPIEEMVKCPSCNSTADVGFWRADGTRGP